MAVKGNFPTSEFRVIGWIHTREKQWWSRMVSFALAQFENLLWHAGLYGDARVVMHGVSHKSIITSLPSWSVIIQRSVRSSLPSKR